MQTILFFALLFAAVGVGCYYIVIKEGRWKDEK